MNLNRIMPSLSHRVHDPLANKGWVGDLMVQRLELHDASDDSYYDIAIPSVDQYLGEFTVSFTFDASVSDRVIFIAPFACYVVGVDCIIGVQGGSGNTLQIERLQGTEDGDAGDDLLSSALNLNTMVVNTVTAGTIASTNIVDLSDGDRLGVVVAGTDGSLADGCVTVHLRRGASGNAAP